LSCLTSFCSLDVPNKKWLPAINVHNIENNGFIQVMQMFKRHPATWSLLAWIKKERHIGRSQQKTIWSIVLVILRIKKLLVEKAGTQREQLIYLLSGSALLYRLKNILILFS
jgi:hypothetical protein